MDYPEPPHLEFHFFIPDATAEESLLQVARAAEAAGETICGTAATVDREMSFEPEDLEAFLHQQEAVRKLGLRGPLGPDEEAPALLLRERISEEAARQTGPPVAIAMPGGPFGGPAEMHGEGVRQAAGTRVYEQFRRLVEQIEPAYAAITVELEMSAPHDLRAVSDLMQFQDFYVGEEFIGAEAVERLADEADPGVYTEEIGTGRYFANWVYNPSGTGSQSQVDYGLAQEAIRAITTAAEVDDDTWR
jgi:hypothetical protein